MLYINDDHIKNTWILQWRNKKNVVILYQTCGYLCYLILKRFQHKNDFWNYSKPVTDTVVDVNVVGT